MSQASLSSPVPQADDAGREIRLAALARKLTAEYADAERARSLFNERWLEDLMQYKGQYPEDVRARLKKSYGARVFYRLTTAKVNTLTARLMDLLFPSRSKNWSIGPTPAPDLPDDVIMEALGPEIAARARELLTAMMQRLEAENTIPDAWAAMKLQAEAMRQALEQADTSAARVRIATERAAAMERVIDDQLKECNANGQRRPSWQQNCRTVVQSACLYGMGVLKGPLVEKVTTKRFHPRRGVMGNVAWSEEVVGEDLRPYHEAVAIWDVFPDPGARVPAELRYVWQLHLMSDKDLSELKSFPGFDAAIIARHITDNPDGDAHLAQWESRIRDLNPDNQACDLRHRYRVYERWGYLSGRELRDAGLDIADQDMTRVYAANVWMVGERIIKAVVNPLEGVDIPYYFFPFQEDETAFWPEGVASLLRAPQSGLNAAVRATQDNAAASSGPIYGVNVQALEPGESLEEMRANRLFMFRRGNLADAFQTMVVPSCIEHNLTLGKFWQEAADEISTPRFNSGDGRVAGAGNTASGLSMLMGASNILLKDHVKDFDDHVVGSFIRAMFRWNMQWNPRDDIKGDFEVVASGSQSLIAKEVRAQQIPAVMAMLGNPAFARYLRDKALLEVALEQTDLPVERLLRTDEEAQQYERDQMVMQATAQAEGQIQALTAELTRQGMPPEQIRRQLVLLLAQAQRQTDGMSAAQAVPEESEGL